MKIVVTGATGFIARNLIPNLLKKNHQIFAVSREPKKLQHIFNDSVTSLTWQQFEQMSPDDVDAVINLAGENIGDTRWSEARKIAIKTSRVNATAKVVTWALGYKHKKPHIYNASAIGIYGLQPSQDALSAPYDESTTPVLRESTDFLSEVGHAWENALKPAITADIPVTVMRFAVVIKKGGGILKKLAPSFSLGLGSILGDGKQAFTWIHIDDLVSGINFLLDHPDVIGPINLCSPECIAQQDFAKTLAHAMHRPLFIKLPANVIKLLFGQMGEELLLSGQNVAPQRLRELGFHFNYPDLRALSAYLEDEY